MTHKVMALVRRPAVDRTFRFYASRADVLRRAIRLDSLPGRHHSFYAPGVNLHMLTAVSAIPEVAVDINHMASGTSEHCYVCIKAKSAAKAAQSCTSYITLYADAKQAIPLEIWQVRGPVLDLCQVSLTKSIQDLDVQHIGVNCFLLLWHAMICATVYVLHMLQTWHGSRANVEVLQVNIHWLNTFTFSAICGQSNTFTLSLHHLTNVSKAVSLFSSRPDQLTMRPNKLTLPRTAQTQLHFRPLVVGSVDTLLNIVERSTRLVVDTMLVQVHTRTPQVTRVFEVDLPIGTVLHKKVCLHSIKCMRCMLVAMTHIRCM
jgi:hypothetical protein